MEGFLSSQQGKLSLSGAEHIQFEVVLHRITSGLRLNGWWEYSQVNIFNTSSCKDKNWLLSRKKWALREESP
jgi:hypothetical protein